MEWQGATYALSSTWILLLLYLQQSMSFPTQLPCQQCCKERAVDLIKAAREARVVINIMRAERGDLSVWKEVYKSGEDRLQLSLRLSQTCQEQPEGSSTG